MSVKIHKAGVRVVKVGAKPNAISLKATQRRPSRSSSPASSTWPATEQQRRCQALAAADNVVIDPLIAVLVPVLNRPHRVRPLVESFRSATSSSDARMYFVAQRSDVAQVTAIRDAGLEPLLVDDVDQSWAKKINRGYARTSEPWLLLGADDLAFRPGWIDIVRVLLKNHRGVIGTNDLGNRATIQGRHSTHPLVRRLYADLCGTVDQVGKICHEGYTHNFPDTELCQTAQKRGLYVHRADCVIEHLHPAWKKSASDSTYELGARSFRRDHALWDQRRRKHGIA